MGRSSILLTLGLVTAGSLAVPYLLPGLRAQGSKSVEEVPAEAATIDLSDKPGTIAFPGAEGFGRYSRGGRGGLIIPVTTNADSGPGSLRACIEATQPRVCIFRVGGVIRFTTQRPLIRNPFITIAGQTAPGGGVLVTHAGGAEGFTPLAIKHSHDVVIRHVRVRTDLNGSRRASNSSFVFEHSRDVMFDHVSGAWALDEIVTGHGLNNNITISNSILTSGIPRHDKCALLGSNARYAQMISFVRNICAHNGDRNPDVNFPPGSCIEVVNNIFYNAASQFAEVYEQQGGTPVSFIGNVFRRGPNSRADIAAIDRMLVGSTGASRIYLSDNRLDGIASLANHPTRFVRVDMPVCPVHSHVLPADRAYDTVLQTAGAFPRDTLDERTVADVRNQGGRILKDDMSLKGPRLLPLIASGTPYADRDGDGMSDAWEAANRTDPVRQDMWQDADADGWPNLDEFLDYAHRQVLAGRALR